MKQQTTVTTIFEGNALNLSSRPVAPAPYDLLPEVPSFTVVSDDFEDGGALDLKFAGPGDDVSPHLHWHGYPEETKSFLINVFDPDAPTPAGFWHWTVASVPSDIRELQTGSGGSDDALPGGSFHLANDGGTHTYMGPYPPEGDRPHRYVFAVHALDVEELDLDKNATPTTAAFQALFHTLARGTITGIYQR